MSAADDPTTALDAVVEEFLGRLRRGEAPDVAAYERAHPALAQDLRELLPALVLMESLKPRPPSASPTRPAHPATIGPYRVVRELGRGGMGRVFEAEAPDGARVAVKVPHAHLVGRAGFVARFLREARAGGAVRHAGVVRTLGSGVHDDGGVEVPYLVLEHVEAGTLRALLDEVGTVSERLAREVGAAVAEALAAIHAAGIVHRDVKPENVFLLDDETVKLADLGVALLRDEADRITQPGEFVGSLLYAAPEQLEHGPVDARADLYALGLLLFELVAGRHPVARPGEVRPLGAAAGRPAPSLRGFAPHVSPLLDALVRSLLSRDREARPASAAETAEALREGERSAWWRRTGGAAPRARSPRSSGPFHGRGAELATLGEAWDAARQGAGGTVVVEGEAGLGKTRLLDAFADRLVEATPEARVLWAEAPLASWSIADALRAALDDGDVAGALARRLPGREVQAEIVARHLAGAPAGSADAHALTAAYAAVLRALSEERPLLLVVDDLHAASPDDRDALARIAEQLRGNRLLLVLGTRPDGRWPAGLAVRRIVLAGLDTEAAGDLARSLLPAGTSSEEVRDLVRRSDGHPLFLLELARARARGHDVGRGGPEALPASLRSILEARLSALGPDERRFLDLAACAGDGFDPVLLCDTLGVRHLEGLQTIHDLDRRHGLLVPEGDRYRFQHHLVEETVREALPPALRRAYHGALGQALEAATRGRPTTGAVAQRLAHHFLLGEDPARAAPYLVAALDHQHGALEYRRAAETAERALAVGPSLPVVVRAHASLILAFGRLTHGRPDAAREQLEDARRLAVEADDPDKEARALFHLAALCRGHDPAGALALEASALERASRTGDPALRSAVLGSHAQTLTLVGRREEARERAIDALALAREARDALTVAHVAIQLGEIEAQLGRAGDARGHLELAIATVRLHGHRLLEATALMGLARVAMLEPAPADAVRTMTDVLSIARELGYSRMETVVLGGLAAAHAVAGDRDAALAATAAAEALAARTGYGNLHARALAARGRLRFEAGDVGPAMADLRDAVRRAEAEPSVASTPVALAELAGPAAWLGDFEAARGALARREARFPASGALERARLALLRAEIEEAEGRSDGAEGLLREALAHAAEGAFGAETLQASLRLGLLLAEAHRDTEALAPLEGALRQATTAGVPGTVAAAQALVAIVRGGDAAPVRIALEAQAHVLPAFQGLRIASLLAARGGGALVAERARDRLERMLATAEPADRARAARDVPLVRRIVGS
ncbi:MAG: protein kinase [Planctomycetota bacterium]